jgi:hypothetical protein
LVSSDGNVREVEYTAKGNALAERHVLALRDKSKNVTGEDPAWVQDYALFLFDLPQMRPTLTRFMRGLDCGQRDLNLCTITT